MPPTYEYVCKTCQYEFECIQKITEDPVQVCPECGKETVSRLISLGTGFVLKGGGWYADGYGENGSGSNSESE